MFSRFTQQFSQTGATRSFVSKVARGYSSFVDPHPLTSKLVADASIGNSLSKVTKYAKHGANKTQFELSCNQCMFFNHSIKNGFQTLSNPKIKQIYLRSEDNASKSTPFPEDTLAIFNAQEKSSKRILTEIVLKATSTLLKAPDDKILHVSRSPLTDALERDAQSSELAQEMLRSAQRYPTKDQGKAILGSILGEIFDRIDSPLEERKTFENQFQATLSRMLALQIDISPDDNKKHLDKWTPGPRGL